MMKRRFNSVAATATAIVAAWCLVGGLASGLPSTIVPWSISGAAKAAPPDARGSSDVRGSSPSPAKLQQPLSLAAARRAEPRRDAPVDTPSESPDVLPAVSRPESENEPRTNALRQPRAQRRAESHASFDRLKDHLPDEPPAAPLETDWSPAELLEPEVHATRVTIDDEDDAWSGPLGDAPDGADQPPLRLVPQAERVASDHLDHLPLTPTASPPLGDATAPGLAPRGFDAPPVFDPGPRDTSRGHAMRSLPGGDAPLDVFSAESSTGQDTAGSVTLEWDSPEEVSVDQPVRLQLHVQNRCDAAVFGVAVHVQLPETVRLDASQPQVSAGGQVATWNLDHLAAGEKRSIELELTPLAQGSLAPTAAVTFTRATSTQIAVRDPQLELAFAGPRTVPLGQAADLRLAVSNPGTGTARNVVVEAHLAEGLAHPEGRLVRYVIGALPPGQSREVRLPVSAVAAGSVRIEGHAVAGETRLAAHSAHELDVVQPQFEIQIEGPQLRYVGRTATYLIEVRNTGSTAAQNVQVFTQLPAGFRFVEANAGAAHDEASGRVSWFLGSLEPGAIEQVGVQTTTHEAGEHRLVALVRADGGLVRETFAETRVAELATIVLDVEESDDPVEVAGETTYEIRVTNRGSSPVGQIEVLAVLPSELHPLDVRGPTAAVVDGQRIRFEAVDHLPAGATLKYHVHALCRRAGDVRLQVYCRTHENPTPVVVEESTHIYQD